MIRPHGGLLVDRAVEGVERERLIRAAADMPSLTLNERELSDLEMIAIGAMSPLEGYMAEDDYRSVLEQMRLAKGLPWSIPVTLAVKQGDGKPYKIGEDVALREESGTLLAVLHLESKYKVDKAYEAENVLRTTDMAHPGAQYLQSVGEVYLGGPVDLVNRRKHELFNDYRLEPK